MMTVEWRKCKRETGPVARLSASICAKECVRTFDFTRTEPALSEVEGSAAPQF